MERICMKENQKRFVTLAIVIAGVYLFMRFLSPILSPFILAFLFAGGLSRMAEKIPFRIKRPILAGGILLIGLVIFLLAAGTLLGYAAGKCGEAVGKIDYYEKELCVFLGNCCDFMERNLGIDGKAVETYVLEQITVFAENLEVKILPSVMNKSLTYAKDAAGILGFLAVFVIAIFLILKDYEKVLSGIKGNKDFTGVLEVLQKIILYLKTYLRAQLVILLVIGSVCAVVLGLTGIEGGIVYGMITGIMDTLPFIGTGIMLIPLAFFQLLSGNYWQGIVIICLYAVCALIREFLEPKLIGDKVGIWPVGILFSVFAGMKLFGIVGIIKGPIGLVIICETCRYLFGEKEENVKEDG